MSNILKIHITNSKPVDLQTFSNSLSSVSSLFASYANKNGVYTSDAEVGLYVEKVKEGSIELWLGVGTAAFLAFAENANIIVDFAKHIKVAYDYYTNKSEEKPDMSIDEMKHYHDMLNVVANDNKGDMSMSVFDSVNGGNIFIGCRFDNNESNNIQNKINRAIEQYKSTPPLEEIHTRVVMGIYQLRSDMNVNTGNKAIIDSISKNKVGLFFESDELKLEVLASDRNPINYAYVVDVSVQRLESRIVAYKVLKLHEVIELQ